LRNLIGSSPEVLGSAGEGRNQISVGLWHFDPDAADKVAERAGVPLERSRQWFDRAFGTQTSMKFARSA